SLYLSHKFTHTRFQVPHGQLLHLLPCRCFRTDIYKSTSDPTSTHDCFFALVSAAVPQTTPQDFCGGATGPTGPSRTQPFLFLFRPLTYFLEVHGSHLGRTIRCALETSIGELQRCSRKGRASTQSHLTLLVEGTRVHAIVRYVYHDKDTPQLPTWVISLLSTPQPRLSFHFSLRNERNILLIN
ncbi:unnamed protein product, partial [Ectocarpus sp. 12 AP-2014]